MARSGTLVGPDLSHCFPADGLGTAVTILRDIRLYQSRPLLIERRYCLVHRIGSEYHLGYKFDIAFECQIWSLCVILLLSTFSLRCMI
jgi:hypothetical protein